MDNALQLLGSLILALLGFVSPAVGLLLSFYREGVARLTAQYKTEETTATANIKEQMKKMDAEKKSSDEYIKEMRENLAKLEAIKTRAKEKLGYLNPQKQMLLLFLPLVLSLLLTQAALIVSDSMTLLVSLNKNSYLIPYKYLLSLFSVIILIYFLYHLAKLLKILTEVKDISDEERRQREARTIELLSIVATNSGKSASMTPPLLENVDIKLDGVIVSSGTKIDLEVQKKKTFRLAIVNTSNQMAKNVEVGFIFPAKDFIIENAESLFSDESQQIARYKESTIQDSTSATQPALNVTVLKDGKYTVKVFVKGENVKTSYMDTIWTVK